MKFCEYLTIQDEFLSYLDGSEISVKFAVGWYQQNLEILKKKFFMFSFLQLSHDPRRILKPTFQIRIRHEKIRLKWLVGVYWAICNKSYSRKTCFKKLKNDEKSRFFDFSLFYFSLFQTLRPVRSSIFNNISESVTFIWLRDVYDNEFSVFKFWHFSFWCICICWSKYFVTKVSCVDRG